MTPSPERSGSSSCRAITPPARRWYWSARRSTRALRIGSPSSEKPIAPASRSSAISVSSAPSIPRVTLATNPTGTEASRSARSRTEPSTAAESIGRLGVGHRDHRAVAARGGGPGARLQVLLVLLAGDAEVDVRVDEGRQHQHPLGVDDLGPVGRRRASRLGQLGDLAAADDHVARLVDALAGIQHPRPADHQRGGVPVALDQEGRAVLRRCGGGHAGCPIRGGSAGAGPRSGLARSVPVSSS